MTIGNFSSGRGNTSVTQLNINFNEFIPTGQLDDKYKNDIHLPFSRSEVTSRQKRNYPVIREKAGHLHLRDYVGQELTQTNPTISVFNNLQNYNPTQGITYFHSHETDKLIHHPTSRPRLESEFMRDVSIPMKIEDMKKKDAPDFHKLPEHSFSIKKRYRT
jgi:hypothetical protein